MSHALDPMLRTIFVALSAAACPAVASAENTSNLNRKSSITELPTVTVSAEKVERSLEKVPASIAVIAGEDLEQSGITAMEQLEGRVAGLSFQPFGQAGMKAPVMRGLTASVHSYSSSVLMLVDDVPTLMPQGFENSFLDVDRIEVLRGPQSTLYGRNAESGVISIHSLSMDNTPRAAISADAGNHNKRAIRLALSSPVVKDALYASISGSWLKQDGFIRNTYTGGKDDNRDHKNLNLGLRWTPSPATDAVLRYVRQGYDDGATLWGNDTDPRARVASGTPSWNRSLGQTFSLNISHELSSGLRLRSITAYNDYKDKVLQDTDFRPIEILYIGRDNHFRTWSQEVRLEGRLGRADWLVGLYGDQGDNDLRNYTLRSPAFYDYRAGLKTQSLALFTNWNVPLTNAWSVSAGARIERMSAEISPAGGVRKKQDWSYFSPKLALQYQINPSNQWYASVGRGVRAGGYNVFVSTLDYPSYAPEENWSYETGFKGWALDKRLRYSVAAYLMKIGNMQVQMQPAFGVLYTASAAHATSKGVELDLDYLLGSGWQLMSGLAWNRTTFDRFQDGATNYAGKTNNLLGAGYISILLLLGFHDLANTPFAVLFMLAMAASLFGTWIDTPVNAMAIRILPQAQRMQAGAIRSTATSLAAIVGGGLMLMLHNRMGWAIPFQTMALGVLSALLLLPLLSASTSLHSVTREEHEKPWHRLGMRQWLAWFSLPGHRVWTVLLLLYFPLIGTVWVFLKPLMLDKGFDPQHIAWVVGVGGGVAAAVASLAGSYLSCKWGVRIALQLFATCNLLAIAALAASMLLSGSPGAMVAAALLVAMMMGASGGLVFGLMMHRIRPGVSALDYGIQSSLFVLGRTLLPLLAGVLLDRLGYIGLLAALGLMLAYLLGWSRHASLAIDSPTPSPSRLLE